MKISRWAMLKVSQHKRSTAFDQDSQYFKTHGYATVKVGKEHYIPQNDFEEETPIIAVRRYEPSTAVTHLAYYYHYGSHRCNLVHDGELGEAVYCYTDMDILLKNLHYDKSGRKTVIGMVSGWLHKNSNNRGRISLDSRSCKLLAYFAPFDNELKLPLYLGEEDKLAMRIKPMDLGAPVKWYRELHNMKSVTMEKIDRICETTYPILGLVSKDHVCSPLG